VLGPSILQLIRAAQRRVPARMAQGPTCGCRPGDPRCALGRVEKRDRCRRRPAGIATPHVGAAAPSRPLVLPRPRVATNPARSLDGDCSRRTSHSSEEPCATIPAAPGCGTTRGSSTRGSSTGPAFRPELPPSPSFQKRRNGIEKKRPQPRPPARETNDAPGHAL